MFSFVVAECVYGVFGKRAAALFGSDCLAAGKYKIIV